MLTSWLRPEAYFQTGNGHLKAVKYMTLTRTGKEYIKEKTSRAESSIRTTKWIITIGTLPNVLKNGEAHGRTAATVNLGGIIA